MKALVFWVVFAVCSAINGGVSFLWIENRKHSWIAFVITELFLTLIFWGIANRL